MISKKNENLDLEGMRKFAHYTGMWVAASLTLGVLSYRHATGAEDVRITYQRAPLGVTIELEPEKPVLLTRTESPKDNNEAATVDKNPEISTEQRDVANEQTAVTAQVTSDIADILKGVNTQVASSIIPIEIEELDPFPMREAMFPGGYSAMQKFIANELNYPEKAQREGQEGVVMVSFIIEKNGDISHVSIVSGTHGVLKEEARRLVLAFPKWIPAENARGKVRTVANLPIRFELAP